MQIPRLVLEEQFLRMSFLYWSLGFWNWLSYLTTFKDVNDSICNSRVLRVHGVIWQEDKISPLVIPIQLIRIKDLGNCAYDTFKHFCQTNKYEINGYS